VASGEKRTLKGAATADAQKIDSLEDCGNDDSLLLHKISP
jgi:hypothetical protein